MKRIHVAAAVLNQTPIDWDGNRAHIVDAIAAARASFGDALHCASPRLQHLQPATAAKTPS